MRKLEAETTLNFISRVRRAAHELSNTPAPVAELDQILVITDGLPEEYSTVVTALDNLPFSELKMQNVITRITGREAQLQRSEDIIKDVTDATAFIARGSKGLPKKTIDRSVICYACQGFGHIAAIPTIRSSPLLENVEILHVVFIYGSGAPGLSVTPNSEEELIPLNNLRRLEMSCIGTLSQAYILTRLQLPVGCSLRISELSMQAPHQWGAILHPSTSTHLAISSHPFTSLKLTSRAIELSREVSKQQHELSLKAIMYANIETFSIPPFDLSFVRRIEIDNTEHPGFQTQLETLFGYAHATEILVLHRRTSLSLLPRVIHTLSQLQQIHLVGIDIDDPAPWAQDVHIADGLGGLLDLRSRRVQDIEKLLAVKTLVLRECKYTPHSLKILQGKAEVTVEALMDLGGQPSSSTERVQRL
ncbi:hypothetical protein EIP86_006599 [Pleurotus ostreatoroseus]|nr:hypothetical protein EIP86_006599 [Pleurotus ostreatoroseus]